MSTVFEFKAKSGTPPRSEHSERDECAVLEAMLEDSLGGVDEQRLSEALYNCDCNTCT